MILIIRTDNPEAEIALYENNTLVAEAKWEAHRLLAETLHAKISELLAGQNKSLNDLHGIVTYQGPGSFTGLRIGLSVANAFAYSLRIPIVGSRQEDWVKSGLERLSLHQSDDIVMPEYGAPVHITKPKK